MSNQKIKPLKKKSLGRGLDSLLGGNSREISEFEKDDFSIDILDERPAPLNQGFVENKLEIPETSRLWEIDIEKLSPLSNQPRKEFDKDELQGLADSIAQKGILQPITAVRKSESEFQIIAGERRWRAAQIAGLHRVPVLLREADEQSALEFALIENIQRSDLNPIEEAEAYALLVSKFQMTQQQLAERVGKDRVTIANLMRLLTLDSEVRDFIKKEMISTGHAKVLAAVIDGKQQRKLAIKAIKEQLSVRALEKLIKKLNNKEKNPIDEIEVSTSLIRVLSEELQKILGSKVNIDYKNGKGKVSFHFYSDDQLNQFCDRMKEIWHN